MTIREMVAELPADTPVIYVPGWWLHTVDRTNPVVTAAQVLAGYNAETSPRFKFEGSEGYRVEDAVQGDGIYCTPEPTEFVYPIIRIVHPDDVHKFDPKPFGFTLPVRNTPILRFELSNAATDRIGDIGRGLQGV